MWLEKRDIPNDAQDAFTSFLADLGSKLENPQTNRNELCRELLAQFLHASSYAEVLLKAPIAALNLDPSNVTLEAEYYTVVDLVKFAKVKPLLWLWYNFDLSPAAQSVEFGVRFRRVLAKHIFKRSIRIIRVMHNSNGKDYVKLYPQVHRSDGHCGRCGQVVFNPSTN